MLILAGLLLSVTTGLADSPIFLVAIKAEQNAKSTEPASMGGWNVEIGEVYQFLRTVSASEYNGGKPGTDATYVAVAVDDIAVFSRADNFVRVADKDIAQAAMKYNQEVAQNRQMERDSAAQEAQAQQPQRLYRDDDPQVEQSQAQFPSDPTSSYRRQEMINSRLDQLQQQQQMGH